MKSSDSKFVILDASAFYSGIPFLCSSMCYTTDDVFHEVKHIKKSHSALEVLIDAGNLQIIEPEAKYVKDASELARETGDIMKMSKADISILALAIQFKNSNSKPLIITDDYAIANVAKTAGIKVSYVMSKGIRKSGRWIRYCAACGISYRSSDSMCKVCGNKLMMRLKS
ncbi:MAG: NOB1 family endonuclease [Nitrososphaerales archaeon]